MTQTQTGRLQLWRFLVFSGLIFSPHSATAQRVPIADDTLGDERSVVSPDQVIRDLPSNRIDGGARRGANLFHSFREFNVDAGRGAYFSNPDGVANILTRVTGNNRSDILGTLGVLGNANLFLLNPNGILFGKNSRLDVGGSFISSTADSFVFSNGFAFSATDPQAPPLLTVSAPIGLQYGSNPGAIRVQEANLEMPDGQTLILAGGSVTVNGGQLLAPGGRVELAGVVVAGTVGLNRDSSLSFPNRVAWVDVSLSNGALVDVAAGGSGSIAIAARNLELTEGSGVQAGIREGLGSAQAQAGNITIQAAENVTLQEMSFIENSTASGGVGNAGDIIVNTRSLSLTNGSQVGSASVGEGDSGSLTVNAVELVQVIGESTDGQFFSGLFTQVENRADAGNVSIDTRNLIVRDGAFIASDTVGEGDGGNLTVNATDSIQLTGTSTDGQSLSGLSARTENRGDAGNLSISTRNLIVRNGALVSSGTFGEGDGGNLTVSATDSIHLIGRTADGQFGSGLFTQTENRGDAGNIDVDTRNLMIRDGAFISSGTFGEGAGGSLIVDAADSVQLIGSTDKLSVTGLFARTENRGAAGNLSINTRNLIVRNGAQVSSGTSGEGAGGSLVIDATDSIHLVGRTADGQFSSGLFTSTENRGDAGNISMNTRNLMIRDGAAVSSGTLGEGTGGNLTVNATDSIQVIGTSVDGQFPSLLTARTTASGNAGDLMLQTRQLIVEDGGLVSSQQSTATATGNVGNVNIETRSLFVGDNASITVEDRRTRVNRQGTEPVGNINIQTNSFTIDSGVISAETASTNGGNINLDVQDLLLLRNRSRISTTAGTAQAGGDGGNITIDGNFIAAVENENSDISANAFTGRGGNVQITTQGIFGIEARPQPTTQSDITASSERGVAGIVAINTPDADPSRGLVQLPVELSDASQLIAQACPTGNAANGQPNQFIVTGRGGLPPTPSEAVNQDAIQVDLVTVEAEPLAQNQPEPSPPSSPSPDTPLTEAQGWQVAADGSITLVAVAPKISTDQLSNQRLQCQ